MIPTPHKESDTVDLNIPRRTRYFEGYILAPTGAQLGDAIRTADISIPPYRERLQRAGNVILTRTNANSTVKELQTEPPTLETCEMVINEIAKRREPELERLRALVKEAAQEVKAHMAIASKERTFWQSRKRSLEEKIEAIIAEEDVTAKDLYRWFVLEDASFQAQAVPAELRAALTALDRERRMRESVLAAEG